ncbi:MAG: hypothetical protein WAV28_07435 [Sedimentisphaerales bacterium]
MRKTRRLWDAYWFPGFMPEPGVSGIFGDPKALVIKLRRRGKKHFAERADGHTGRFTTARCDGFGICPVGTVASGWMWRSDAFCAGVAGR